MDGNARASESSGDPQRVEEVLKAEQALDEALLKGDMDALDALLAPEVTRTNPRGTLSSRAEWFAEMNTAIRTVGRSYSFIEREAQQVRLYGETAVVTGIVHIRGSRVGPTAEPNTNRYLRFYVRRQGRWQLVAHQATRLTSP